MPRDWSAVVRRYAERHHLPDAERAAIERFVVEQIEGQLVTIDTEPWGSFSDATTLRLEADLTTESVEGPRVPTVDAERYLDLGPLGVGGMGEVRRVRDLALNRVIAMKIMRSDWVGRAAAEARFVAEAQATAQLQHSGVVPVHDLGRLPDGRWFFTMKEIRGPTLQDLLEEARSTPERWPLRRVLESFRTACEAVAYAHSRGAVHRDFKPENVVVGEFGDVIVLDWGLVKATGSSDSPIERIGDAASLATRAGAVLGTPTWMSPEQAAGGAAEATASVDVYALGAVLYAILAGRPPYSGSSADVLEAVRTGAPPPLPTGCPDDLRSLCLQAMARAPADRPADAATFTERLSAWLDGAARREKALRIVAEADALQPIVEGALARAARLRAEAWALKSETPSWAPTDRKRPIWQREDAARAAQREADLVGLNRLQLLRAALTEDPELNEAHERLAYVYQWCHQRAEEQGNADEALQYDVLLRAYDTGTYASYLAGNGRLTLHTEPEVAHATLYRMVEVDRLLKPVLDRDLGATPLLALQLPIGSWLIRLLTRGRAPVDVPVWIARQQHADGQPPGSIHSVPIWLPAHNEFGAEDHYVPAGWSRLGGDPNGEERRPPRRVWVDAFVIRKHPVTCGEWIEFLEWLKRNRREEEALAHLPRSGAEGRTWFEQSRTGQLVLGHDDDGRVLSPRQAVTGIPPASARAYASWLFERTGVQWRLPWEAEWEKAARGVDGRPYVTGAHLDPTWAHVRGCTDGLISAATVDAFPLDESVYGVRGMSGGVHELCGDRWDGETLRTRSERPVFEAATDDEFQVVRGGARTSMPFEARVDQRVRLAPGARSDRVGFRLARTYESGRSAQRGVAWRFGG